MRGPTVRRHAAVLLAVAAAAAPRAQDVGYAVTPATLALGRGAPAVVRAYETRYVVEGPGRAREHVRLVMTALAPAGHEDVVRLVVPHDVFRRVESLSGVLRDVDGRVVRRLRRDDVEDYPAAGESFYDDLRLRTAELSGAGYPFTVEWTYEVEHRGVLGWPTWYPQRNGHPVERASFTLDVPTGTPVRYRAQRLDAEPVQGEVRGRTTYTWVVAGRAALEVEPLGPAWQEQAPALFLGTTRFEIGGVPGRLDTWEAFGAWYASLSAGRTTLPEAARTEVARLIAGADTDREKARRIYEYVQRTTRYVSVQLGLGGWQPDPAETVFTRGYGDCKALSNYLVALLAEAGVRAYPALIRAGHHAPALDSTFTANVFNHVIVHVPLADGPLWLESTSTTAPFGRLGPFTEDRLALLVTETGGRLVPTPTARPDDNRSARTAEIRLDAAGAAEVRASWALLGAPRDEAVHALGGRPPAEREAWFRTATGSTGFDVMSYDVGEADHPAAEVRLSAVWTAPRLAARAGARLLLTPHLLAPPATIPPAAEARTQPVHLRPPAVEIDSVRFDLPEGFVVEAAPRDLEITTDFGRYARRLAVSAGGRALVYVRRFEVAGARLPPEAYEGVRAFYQAVARADAERVALARAPSAPSAGGAP
ncbi:MAG TPA: DUF3857 domain-containing protein [Rubricoccaceae bacterium]|nr:DUF3857 domain-containing protein [Rubricoccaceae bacterium]